MKKVTVIVHKSEVRILQPMDIGGVVRLALFEPKALKVLWVLWQAAKKAAVNFKPPLLPYLSGLFLRALCSPCLLRSLRPTRPRSFTGDLEV